MATPLTKFKELFKDRYAFVRLWNFSGKNTELNNAYTMHMYVPFSTPGMTHLAEITDTKDMKILQSTYYKLAFNILCNYVSLIVKTIME